MKILIADDHSLFRKGLANLMPGLATETIEILEAGDWQTAVGTLARHPDCALAVVDLHMPGMEAFAGLSALIERAVTVPVVVMTASESPLDMKHALDIGVMGYVAKSEAAAVMVSALRLVLAGGIYVPPRLVLASSSSAPARAGALPFGLTVRQYEVLERLAQGASNKAIAQDLALSERTVKAHVGAIFKALGVGSRQQAIALVESKK
jgi:two-component system, NarL family, nitrate/nitrite response regulator NarL